MKKSMRLQKKVLQSLGVDHQQLLAGNLGVPAPQVHVRFLQPVLLDLHAIQGRLLIESDGVLDVVAVVRQANAQLPEPLHFRPPLGVVCHA